MRRRQLKRGAGEGHRRLQRPVVVIVLLSRDMLNIDIAQQEPFFDI